MVEEKLTMPVIDVRDAIRGLTSDLGVDNRVLAGAMQTDESAVKRWLAGAHYPQRDSRARLDALIALRDHVMDTFDALEAAKAWMHTDNRYLGWLSLVNVLLAGRIDRVEAALAVLDAGMFI